MSEARSGCPACPTPLVAGSRGTGSVQAVTRAKAAALAAIPGNEIMLVTDRSHQRRRRSGADGAGRRGPQGAGNGLRSAGQPERASDTVVGSPGTGGHASPGPGAGKCPLHTGMHQDMLPENNDQHWNFHHPTPV